MIAGDRSHGKLNADLARSWLKSNLKFRGGYFSCIDRRMKKELCTKQWNFGYSDELRGQRRSKGL